MEFDIKTIGEAHGLSVTEVKRTAALFMGVESEILTHDEALRLENILKTWKKGAHAADYLGVSRQRFAVLVSENEIQSKKFGPKTIYWRVRDLDRLKNRKPGRPWEKEKDNSEK